MHISMHTVFRNMSTKHNKYVVNKKSILMISAQKTFKQNQSVFCFLLQNKICPFPKTRYAYLQGFFYETQVDQFF